MSAAPVSSCQWRFPDLFPTPGCGTDVHRVSGMRPAGNAWLTDGGCNGHFPSLLPPFVSHLPPKIVSDGIKLPRRANEGGSPKRNRKRFQCVGEPNAHRESVVVPSATRLHEFAPQYIYRLVKIWHGLCSRGSGETAIEAPTPHCGVARDGPLHSHSWFMPCHRTA